MIDSNEVKSVHFWFVNPTDLYNVSQLDCADIIFTDGNYNTIITDRKIIERYVAIINNLKPINPKLVYDVRATSLIRMKQINGKKKKNVQVCIDPVWGRVLLNNILMQGDREQIYEFLNDALYKPLTPDDWIPSYMKEYLKDHPEERDKVLSPVP